MSAQALSLVWDIPEVTAEERLILIWIANSCGDLGHPYSPEWVGMGEFIGSNYQRAFDVTWALVDKGLLKWGGCEECPESYLWIVYDGPYSDPIDWTAETKSRSKRVVSLIERDGPRCAYCDCTPIQYEVDHFIPRARGGDDNMANLVLACKQCNRRKRDTMPEVFLKGDPQRYRAIASGLEAIYAL
jgi:hypothetical protein